MQNAHNLWRKTVENVRLIQQQAKSSIISAINEICSELCEHSRSLYARQVHEWQS